MIYYSLNDTQHTASFKTAVKKGLAPDKGLYFPKTIPTLSDDFWQRLPQLSKTELALEVIRPTLGMKYPMQS